MTLTLKQALRPLGVLVALAVVSVNWVKARENPGAGGPGAPAKPAAQAADLFPDAVVARGKGFEIKRSRLDEDVTRVRANYTARGQEIPPAQLPLLEKQLLDNLILTQILVAKATEADKAKGREEGEKHFDLIKKNAPSEEILLRQLKTMDLNFDSLRNRLNEEATVRAMLQAKVTVTDDEVKKYYDDNPAKFEEPEMVRASHILIGTVDPKTNADLSDAQKRAKKKLIDDLLKRARAGEDFAKLAQENSEDPGSKDRGGEYTFPRGKMVPEFEAAAFSLKTNQVSDVVTTRFGYHIIKLSEKIPAKKLAFATVSPDVRTYLEQTAIEKMKPKYLVSLEKEAGVEILDEQLKTIDAGGDTPARNSPGVK
jgi:parvulin-like peptidyl-prolyl isomerase